MANSNKTAKPKSGGKSFKYSRAPKALPQKIFASAEVLRDWRLNPSDKIIYMALSGFTGKGQNTVWPRRSTLTQMTGIKENKVSVCTAKLAKVGWIVKSGNGGRNHSAFYELRVVEIPERIRANKAVPKKDGIKTLRTRPELGQGARPDLGRRSEPTSEPIVAELTRRASESGFATKHSSVPHPGRSNLAAPMNGSHEWIAMELARLDVLGHSGNQCFEILPGRVLQ
jgi:hypothetical protein